MNKAAVLIIISVIYSGLAGCSKVSSQTEYASETVQTSGISTEEVTEEPSTIEPFPGAVQEPPLESEDEYEELGFEKSIMIGTDIHYLSQELTDYGPEFEYMIEHGDGRAVMYIDQITDAFISEVVDAKPDLLILSGDLSFNSEKLSHQEFAVKLEQVENAEIPVLVIPGNHDINNPQAAVYDGASKYPAETTTPQEFRQIYGKFGYDEALSSDTVSLSYVYQLDDYTRIMMLDSCQYAGYAKVGGAIKTETYDWIEDEVEDAWLEGMNIIPVAHHNLLDQSEVYVDDCTIEHSEELIELLEGWGVPLFLSGHLHVQHMKESNRENGIFEIVSGSLTTPECRYGILNFRDDASYDYRTKQLDVEAWAKKNNSKEEDLIRFNTFKGPFLKRVFYNQAYDALTKLDLTEEELKEMCDFYARLNFYYYQGSAFEIKDELVKEQGYKIWTEKGIYSQLYDYVDYMLKDAQKDYNTISAD